MRRILACRLSGMSPISSRKACRRRLHGRGRACRRRRRRTRPCGGRRVRSRAGARQGGAVLRHDRLRDRSLARWIVRAKTSLPVPVSPRSSTGTFEAAARRARSRAARMAGLSPIHAVLATAAAEPRLRFLSQLGRSPGEFRIGAVEAADELLIFGEEAGVADRNRCLGRERAQGRLGRGRQGTTSPASRS